MAIRCNGQAMRQGVIDCPAKGRMALGRCKQFRDGGLARCQSCSVKPILIAINRMKGNPRLPSDVNTHPDQKTICPLCKEKKSKGARRCWNCRGL